MKLSETGIEDLVVLEPKVHGDDRGYFMESYNKKILSDFGLNYHFIQDNQSKSRYGVLRGLHYQNPPYAQTKLIRVLHGCILDVAVDIRKSSQTYLKHFAIELSEENKKQLLVPKGFAHGFLVLSESAEILYKCDEFYNPEHEGGLHFNDSSLNIDWKIPSSQIVLSDKDAKNPNVENMINKFE
ncbi:MAG: dTDP-4-dehydrorhamnose 3,5-epimerase [Candidatus Cyclobacteriaceae bacterium M2_1C_046]